MIVALIPTWLQEWEQENDCMPTYEYVCPNCGKKFEQKQAMENRATALCPKCGTVSPLVMSIVNHKKFEG